ncbi:NAD(P)/FAD-dependent oxidoreductase [Cereibacter sphaeroides]|uniref:NAD(P)/FAD-dependent oxidoreductase n=1 Tax=Cereibacter sphaeroides TaxID=1063 RepID=UPI001F3D583F|nr:FAD-binding oxidoreductase [Cereibacter sphaeroides]MCE6969337.1 FAD-binding oxidoreductase [Cereibacter sphaeroides]
MHFPISMAVPARFIGPPPAACDVVVIGGGVIGVMSAWYLAERGLSVTLCEKGRIAGEQSSRNWGWIRQQGRDPAELPIMVESLRLWRGLSESLRNPFGFRQAGVLYLANREESLAAYDAWLPHAQEHGLDTRLLGRRDLGDKLGAAADHWLGGLFTPSDGQAEPWLAVPALSLAAAERGVTLVEECAVRALDIAGGRVAGVVTERGRIACSDVVLAGGAWSSLFARAYGVNLPQLSVLASVARTEPMPEILPGAAADDDFAIRRNDSGGYTIAGGSEHDFFIGPDAFRHALKYRRAVKKDFLNTHYHWAAPRDYPDAWNTPRTWSASMPTPFERVRMLNPQPNLATLARAQTAFARAFPDLGRPKVQATWAGMIDTMPDVVPVIDRAPSIPGLTIATGMSGHGFGIGPGVGRVVADLVTGGTIGHDLTRFRLSRFTDGSEIILGPSL